MVKSEAFEGAPTLLTTYSRLSLCLWRIKKMSPRNGDERRNDVDRVSLPPNAADCFSRRARVLLKLMAPLLSLSAGCFSSTKISEEYLVSICYSKTFSLSAEIYNWLRRWSHFEGFVGNGERYLVIVYNYTCSYAHLSFPHIFFFFRNLSRKITRLRHRERFCLSSVVSYAFPPKVIVVGDEELVVRNGSGKEELVVNFTWETVGRDAWSWGDGQRGNRAALYCNILLQ